MTHSVPRRRATRRSAAIVAMAVALAAPAAASAQMTGGDDPIARDVARIRAATEKFHSLDEAVAAGYASDAGHCVDNPPHGAMGYHHLNEALLDRTIELERPEMLTYERTPDGEYRFTGVEFIVPFSAWPETEEPPEVMGQELKPAPSLQIWYLHAWVWRENPSGLFADWNPSVECR